MRIQGPGILSRVCDITAISRPHDAIIISDIHLGSAICHADHLIEFLEQIGRREIKTRELVLNGDIFDSIDFRRLKKNHWEVLSLIRALSDRMTITWVSGNHDGPAEMVRSLLGVRVKDEHTIVSGSSVILVMHGHTFDDFLDSHPLLTFLADFVYRLLQKIDRTHRLPRTAKVSSKIFLRCIQKIRERATQYAKDRGYHAVCCGHTHHAEAETTGDVAYFNSGCWTETPSTYLTVRDGCLELRSFITAGTHAVPTHPALIAARAVLN